MARGVRSSPTLLPTFSPNLQPQSLSSYDPLTRRNTILVATIVPTLKLGDQTQDAIPADRFYINLGVAGGTGNIPSWLGGVSNGTYAQWDSTEKTPYLRLSNVGGASFGQSGIVKVIHPLGVGGSAPNHAPKNATVAAVWVRFKARFNANADYGTNGVGANNGTGSEFSTSSNRFIQVLRNSGNWELGSCDGTTISQDSVAGGDGAWHEFWVRWEEAVSLKLYVDATLVITKTSNLPDRPLFPAGNVADATNTIDIVDYLVEWELG